MQYLFIAFAALAVAAFAPIKVTVSLIAVIAVVSLVVKFIATTVIGQVSIIDAARAVALAIFLLAAAVLGVLWANQGELRVEGIATLILIGGLFAAFVLGFKIALQASFGASAVIAAASTTVSAALLFALRPVLF